MIIHKKSANAVAGKMGRVCEACVRRRARWYCTADDAFLCQVCDISVHSANQLASRHERVQLETSGLTKSRPDITEPSWLHGFTKKARTRRHAHINKSSMPIEESKKDDFFSNPNFPLVPEIGSNETSIFDENEEHIFHQVPVFNPFEDHHESMINYEQGEIDDLEKFLLPSDNELAEFTADMESLLGGESNKDRHEEKCARVKAEHHEEGAIEAVLAEGAIEAVLAVQFDPMADVMREITDWNFEYESPMIGQEVDKEKMTGLVEQTITGNYETKEEITKNKITLKLNYDGVITSWANQGSPWITGIRTEFNSDDCWPDFMVMCPTNLYHPNGYIGGLVGADNGEREAKVSRYREKRRTRLFSKKIRYEVRKLNAEKRPRMKGRFVKRTPFAVPTFSNNNYPTNK